MGSKQVLIITVVEDVKRLVSDDHLTLLLLPSNSRLLEGKVLII